MPPCPPYNAYGIYVTAADALISFYIQEEKIDSITAMKLDIIQGVFFPLLILIY